MVVNMLQLFQKSFVDSLEQVCAISSSFPYHFCHWSIDRSALPSSCHCTWCWFGKKSIQEKTFFYVATGGRLFLFLGLGVSVSVSMREGVGVCALAYKLTLLVTVILTAMRLHFSLFQRRKHLSLLQIHIYGVLAIYSPRKGECNPGNWLDRAVGLYVTAFIAGRFHNYI